MTRTAASFATAGPSSRPLDLIDQPQWLIDNPSRSSKIQFFNTPTIATSLSMPIARAPSGGLAHVIFNLPSRITLRDNINLFCRDAKLKMLCQMFSRTFDPDNRLVAAELERRWNEALKHHNAIEEELRALRANRPEALNEKTRRALLQLGEDLPALWNHPQSSKQLKKRIVRTLLHEIVVTKAGEKISMILHWQGGDHTVMEFLKNKTGQHRSSSAEDLEPLVRELARLQPDAGIVSILNRLGRRTGRGHTWTEGRLRVFPGDHSIPVYKEGERAARDELTLEETAKTFNVSKETIRRLIASKAFTARQACAGAPWIIRRDDIERIAATINQGGPRTENANQISLELQ
jgi:hypothetical protein